VVDTRLWLRGRPWESVTHQARVIDKPHADHGRDLALVDQQSAPGLRGALGAGNPIWLEGEQMVSMGMEEGMAAAAGQIDELLRAGFLPPTG
jgi:hypothetical protein